MTRVLAVLLGIVLLSSPLAAQEARDEKPNFAEPKKDWKWDDDKRFDSLMERLASQKASLGFGEVAGTYQMESALPSKECPVCKTLA